ncbi:hypothetical protein [Naasia sp. SYSU D00948]|uniref:hypothetical protein n=1 Tax=Naasia sp. SYSU D00948 TaxID=2817379 RepID=UPI001FEDAADF|nr:hypothetical protein [Naasia sp. SYSU D00948]
MDLAEHAAADAAWGLPEPEPREWRSGPWSVELRGDELADIRFEDRLVLRAVRAVARDRDWGTVPVEVLSTTAGDRALTLEVRMAGLGADLLGAVELEATGESLAVAFHAVSRTDFLRNRIGLVVLHPPGVAGAPLAVVDPEGRRTDTRFPESISPHQPAFDIARLEWASCGLECSLDFAGDVFEMEDQRNWTDASFKTYSTPLALPFPVLVPAGTELRQSLTLSARVVGPADPEPEPGLVVLEDAARPFPSVSVGASTAPEPAPRLGIPPADALVVELDLTTANWRAALQRAAREAGPLPLDVRLVADEAARLAEAVDALADHRIARLGVYDATTHVTETPLLAGLRDALRDREVAIVGGARSHFTELNRNHERLDPSLPALAYSVTPEMHAVERSQLVESIPMQRLVALDAVAIADGRPVFAGPFTLKARFNAVATSSASAAQGDDLSAGYGAELIDATDPRQTSPALAAWTIASAAASAVPGVAGLAYFELWGPRGLCSASGEPYPVARAVAWLAALSGQRMLVDPEPGRGGVWVVGAVGEGGTTVLAANLASRPRSLRVVLPDGRQDEVELEPLGAERREY